MNLIADTILSHLPYSRKTTPSGWISFNAICCSDRRNRGGFIIDGESLSYHCFNCGFKASWQPGRSISVKMRQLLQLLSVPTDIISKIYIEAMRLKDTEIVEQELHVPKFVPKTLPRGSKRIIDLLDDPSDQLVSVIEYIYSRALTLEDYDFYWSSEEGFDNRLIIPYYFRNQIVGYTCRRIDEGKAKYLADQQPGYVFNLDRQNYHRQFIIVCEGQFDAISIDGVAVMSNEINKQQSMLINQLGKKVVVVPDRDQAGLKIIESALDNNYKVSMPDWDNDIKDINDAVKYYGKLKTLLIIKNAILESELKIKLRSREWLKSLEF